MMPLRINLNMYLGSCSKYLSFVVASSDLSMISLNTSFFICTQTAGKYTKKNF